MGFVTPLYRPVDYRLLVESNSRLGYNASACIHAYAFFQIIHHSVVMFEQKV